MRIVDGQTATLDFAMTQSVVQLAEVVTTATGEQRRVEVGTAVENLSVSAITETAPVRTISDVLTARVPGVMVQQGTQTGSGQRIRVRGISSLSLSNEPIFVIDGIRMSSNNGSTSFGNGGNDFSRLGDISPEDIENIEIVKGPSAATLYGTDAANGVVVITTKKGRAGNAHWTTYGEGGVLDDRNWYADNYTLAGMNPTTKAKLVLQGQCTLVMVSLGTCVKSDGTKGYDSVRIYSPIKDPSAHAARHRQSQRRRRPGFGRQRCRCATSCPPAATTKSASSSSTTTRSTGSIRWASRSIRGRCIRTRAC